MKAFRSDSVDTALHIIRNRKERKRKTMFGEETEEGAGARSPIQPDENWISCYRMRKIMTIG